MAKRSVQNPIFLPKDISRGLHGMERDAKGSFTGQKSHDKGACLTFFRLLHANPYHTMSLLVLSGLIKDISFLVFDDHTGGLSLVGPLSNKI